MDDGRQDLERPAYTYATAAEWLGMKVKKLQAEVYRGSITFVKLGQAVRFRQRDLDEYVAAGVKPRKPEHQQLLVPPG